SPSSRVRVRPLLRPEGRLPRRRHRAVDRFFPRLVVFFEGRVPVRAGTARERVRQDADLGGDLVKIRPKEIGIALVLASSIGVFGCSNEKPGPFEKAGKKADEKADELKKEVDAAAEKTKKDLKEARKKAEETGEAIAEKAKEETEKAAEK